MLGHNAWRCTVTADGGLALPGSGRLVTADPLPARSGGDHPVSGGGTAGAAAAVEAVEEAEAVGEAGAALAIFGPEAVSLHREQPSGSPRNVWPGRVREITAVGSRLRVVLGSARVPDLVAEITPAAAVELGLTEGAAVWASVKATEVTVVRL